MFIVFHLLVLLLTVGRCINSLIFDSKTVDVGHSVKLTCPRKSPGSLFWIRIYSRNSPEVLGKTYGWKMSDHVETLEEPGTFVLYIKKAKLTDTAVYYCFQTTQSRWKFWTGTDLRVKEPETHITAVPSSDTESVTLQSTVSGSGTVSCPEEDGVCCFRAESHPSCQTLPNLSYIQANGVDERLCTKQCVCSLFKNITSADVGTFHCAVISCGKNASIPNSQVMTGDTQKDDTVLYLLCASLTISLLVITFLVCSIKTLKKRPCGCCNVTADLQTNPATTGGDHQSQKIDEDSLVYSVATFTSRKASKGGTREAKTEEEESIYTDVRAAMLD